jgi:hypothetical protein
MSREDPDTAGSVTDWPPGSVNQDRGSTNPEEIFKDPQH